MQHLTRIGPVLASVVFISAAAAGPDGLAEAQQRAIDTLLYEQPRAGALIEDQRVRRLYGSLFEGGVNPEDSAARFLAARDAALNVRAEHIKPGNRVGRETQELMLDRETGRFKFTAVYQRHEIQGVPVHDSYATVLVRNEPGYPVVLVVNDLKGVGEFRPDHALAIDVQRGRNLAGAMAPGVERFTPHERIIWVGDDGPRDAYRFEGRGMQPGTNVPRHELFIIDARTNLLLHRESLIHHRSAAGSQDIDGEVVGYATPGLLPDVPSNQPQLMSLPDARILGFQNQIVDVTDEDGYFAVPSSAVPFSTLTSRLVGPWANVVSDTTSNSSVSLSVDPFNFMSFVHNQQPNEFTTAQVNAMIHTNLVRNFVVSVNPQYPAMNNQLLVRVNIDESCNAFFTTGPLSINFYTSQGGGGCPNTAYSTVVYHEYGHYIINRAGTGQGAYGEGMSDVLAMLITGSPSLGLGFQGGSGPLRSTINSVTYPCNGGVHFCGQVLSGAMWNLREQLAQTRPDDFEQVLADLVINSILLNPSGIGPGLVYDFLALDGDGTFDNGTPHFVEITSAFAAKGLGVPLNFNNSCSYTKVLPAGQWELHNDFAGSTGYAEPLCESTGDGQIYHDRWYAHIPQHDGILTISLCGSEVPTRVGVYDFPCPQSPGELLACGVGNCDKPLTVPVTQGHPFRIRVGSQTANVTGTIHMSISNELAPPCPADLTGSGTVGAGDLLVLMAAWGQCDGTCPADLNDDGIVNVGDLMLLMDQWGACE